MSVKNFLFWYFAMINVLSYIIMWIDKHQAKRKSARIAEQTLILIALLGGGMGVYLGMKTPPYHKASKVKFRIGIPFCIAFHIIIIYLITFRWHLLQ